MENPKPNYSNHPMPQSSSRPPNYGVDGVCMISSAWREKQHSSFINFISSFLSENSIRLNYVSISPDIIFNCAGISLAFVFVTQWVCENLAIFSRIQKLKEKFASLYVVVTLSTKEQNDSFVRSYFKYRMEFGNPTFVPVLDPEMGFESVVKIAHSRGVCKRQDAKSKMEAERKRSMQDFDVFLRVVTSIPGINDHDAIALNQAIGSIEAIAKAPKEYIIQNTDLSAEKAEIVTRFFRDPKFYMSPKVDH